MAIRDIHRGRIVHLTVEDVTLPNGHVMPLEIVRHPGAAAIATFDGDGRRDAAPAVPPRGRRVPVGGAGGKARSRREPATCAARELAEEAGLVARDLEHVGSIVTCPGFCDEVIHLFVATGLRKVPNRLGADEVIDAVTTVPLCRRACR